MAKHNVTEFIFDNGTYYMGRTESGGAGVGMNSVCHLRVPAGHALLAQILALTPETVEDFVDEQVGQGRMLLN